MAIQDSTFPLQEALFCDEPQWEDVNQDNDDDDDDELQKETSSLQPVHVTDEDLHWSDDELTTLFKNETNQNQLKQRDLEAESAVKWMMSVVEYYGFKPTTAILAVDYFDRFTSYNHRRRHCNVEKQWTMQLTAVACLSLAAKVEETQAPLLLDLQVEGAKFMFQSKTIQRMELLVLSTLQWRMHPVTPFSFIDYVIRRLGLIHNLQVLFLDHSSRILTSLVADSRWGLYPSSALASATMLHVMDQLEDQGCCSNSINYQNQLFSSLLSINKEKVSECYKLVQELNICVVAAAHHKGKFTQVLDSPKAVIDTSSYILTSDSSNDSWDLNSTTTTMLLQLQQSSSSSAELPAFKRTRFDDDKDHNLIIE